MFTNSVVDNEPIWRDGKDDEVEIGQRMKKVREKIRSILTPLVTERHKDAELDYLIKTTHALVTSNNEIWNRCKANLRYIDLRSEINLKKHRHERKEEPVLYYFRRGFNQVATFQTRNQSGALELRMNARYLQQDKNFTLPCLPHALSIVVIPVVLNDGMLNYHQYLKRALILEESVLILFLASLKDHLEEFQVFLGDVESWLMGSTRSAHFLKKIFNVELPENLAIDTNTLLRTIPCAEAHTLSFDVTCHNGQERLNRFLSFVTHPAFGDE